jgi:hypothetical protein
MLEKKLSLFKRTIQGQQIWRVLSLCVLILTIGVFMGLHDIDKQTGGRIAPQPNTNDSVQQRMAQGTNQVQNSSDETETDGLQFKERQILAVQDGENKAVFGFIDQANRFGLKVAADGVDVLTADAEDLLFDSERNAFVIVGQGIATIEKAAGASFGTVAIDSIEGVNRPAVIAFDADSGDSFPGVITPLSGTHAGKISEHGTFDTFGGTYVFSIYTPDYGPGANALFNGAYTKRIKYFVLQQSAN